MNEITSNESNKSAIIHRGFEAVIGLEIHAQLSTKSKIFSSDATTFEAGDNENTCPVSVGMPGALPVLNAKVVELATRAGLALNCDIRRKSVFARKNYFYPDLPKGYQISQYDEPICENGSIDILIDGVEKRIEIVRAHLEEDAGKSTHFADMSLINYNRSGIPLLEIVSAHVMNSAREAAEYARSVRQVLLYVNVCDGNLEEGSLRCDCNVSVRRIGDKKLGTKVELKNINSFRFIEKAIDYEIDRQIECVERGERIVQETRLWDSDKNRTYSMRTKEDAQDYRYFPDPDLLPLVLSDSYVNSIRGELPELPSARRQRYCDKFGLSLQDTLWLTEEKSIGDFFENVVKICDDPKSSANWIMTELARELKSRDLTIEKSPVSSEHIGQLIKLINSGAITGKIAKSVFMEIVESGKTPMEIVKEKGLSKESNPEVIEKIVNSVIEKNQAQFAELKAGKMKVMGFLIGAIMKESQGKAHPDVVNAILKKKISGN